MISLSFYFKHAQKAEVLRRFQIGRACCSDTKYCVKIYIEIYGVVRKSFLQC